MTSHILQKITKDDHLRAAIFAQEKAENDRLAQEASSAKLDIRRDTWTNI